MHEGDLVLELLMVIAAAAVGAALFERLRLPAIAGFLVTGAVVGPGGLGLVHDPERVVVLAEFGVAFLLFEIGLELPLEQLRREWRTVVIGGLLQVSLTLVGVAAFGAILDLGSETDIVLGMLAAMSSTALVIRVLGGRDELDAPHGRIALGILLFQDLCIVPFLLAVPILAGEVERDLVPVLTAVVRAIVSIGLLYGVGRFAFPWVIERVVRLRSPDLFSVFAFLLAMGSAVLAQQIGLTLAVGAFIAGLVVSASPYNQQLFAEVAPLRGVLLGIFFTSIGMLLDPVRALAAWEGILVFLVGVTVLKTLIVVGIVLLVLRQSVRVAVKAGLSLAQTGEFSFVLAGAAAAAGLLDEVLVQVFVAGSILTLIATPFLIRVAPAVADWLVGAASTEPEASTARDELQNHVVIVGYGLAGSTLGRVLKASNIPYTVVESNPRTVAEARKRGEPIGFGDAARPAILEHLGVPRAQLVAVAINDPEATRRCVLAVRAMAPHVQIVARARYQEELDPLFEDGANQVVVQEFESSIDLFSKVLRTFGIPAQAIVHFADEMREEGYELLRTPELLAIDPWLAELLEEIATEWIEVPEGPAVGSTIAGLDVRARTGVNVLAVRRAGEMDPNPEPDFTLRAGDELLVAATGEELQGLRSLLSGED